ncbi:MAG: proton-conducting transporter membrane subunit, partial [Candidatus Omnitrophota bacterium]
MSVCDMAVVSILIPLLGAPLLPFLGAASKKIRNLAALTMVLLPLVIYAALLPGWIGGHTGHVYAVSTPALAQFGVIVDGLALVMAFTSALISLIIVVYSFQYIDHYSHQNEYYAMVVIFFGAMMGLVFSSSILYLYVFWEITAVTSWRLIGFFRKDSDWARADKSFYLTVFGALAMLAGFLMIGQQAGTFNLEGIRAVYQTVPVSKTAVSLILLGILAKSATLPLHSWLPDAGVAPSPVTALLHAAVLVKIGVYAYARIFIVNIPLDFEIRQVIMIIAGFSALISAGAAFVETDLKRIIAYSTISQIGFIFLGLASGALIGVAGALLYILMHGLAKGGLFLCAGIIE